MRICEGLDFLLGSGLRAEGLQQAEKYAAVDPDLQKGSREDQARLTSVCLETRKMSVATVDNTSK